MPCHQSHVIQAIDYITYQTLWLHPTMGHRTVVIFKLLEHIPNNIIHINGIRNHPTFNNRALKM